MEREDIQTIFGYIRQLHPHTPEGKVPKLTVAVAKQWCSQLDGYTVDQVSKAAQDHSAQCRFWPSLSEIKGRLPPLPECARWRHERMGAAEQQSWENGLAWQKRWHQELRIRGLPTLAEALEAGMAAAEYSALLDGAGVWELDHVGP